MKSIFCFLLACLLAAVFMAALTGCPSDMQGLGHVPAVGTSIDQAHAHVDSAENAVQKAKPHADPTGKEILGIASDEHRAADKSLADANAELAKVQADLAAAKSRADKAEKSLAEERTHWVGYRARLALRWIIGISLGVTVLLGVLQAFSAVPFVAIVAKILTAIATAGLSIVHGVTAWGTRKAFGITQAVIMYQSRPGETPAK